VRVDALPKLLDAALEKILQQHTVPWMRSRIMVSAALTVTPHVRSQRPWHCIYEAPPPSLSACVASPGETQQHTTMNAQQGAEPAVAQSTR
jgi:hypothetical protein